MPLTKTDERYFLDLTELVDASEWEEARELMMKLIQMEKPRLVKAMMDYYREYACELCLGDGYTLEGDIVNKERRKCICQVEV